ncbi:hypothetical protein BU16DRAFT_561208 [Lophium mytilinum]|uniref:Uncharacterized protein n=1 Tax=Lophium mytilinum TaxID=390894 RepID=A0A6A6QW26_9PEZI|nr:hypothetical protein BU16DRAFT_561208 [Lophium mytilinum]
MKHFLSTLCGSLALLISAVNGAPFLDSRQDDGPYCGELSSEQQGASIDGVAGGDTHLMLTKDKCHPMILCAPKLVNNVRHVKVYPECACYLWDNPTCGNAAKGVGVNLDVDLPKDLDQQVGSYWCKPAPNNTLPVTILSDASTTDLICKLDHPDKKASTETSQTLPPAKRAESHDLVPRTDTCGFFSTEHGGQGNFGFLNKDELCHTFPPGFDNGVSSIHVSDGCECSFWLEHHCISWPDVHASNAFKDLNGKFDKELSTYSCRLKDSNAKTGFFYGAENVTSI